MLQLAIGADDALYHAFVAARGLVALRPFWFEVTVESRRLAQECNGAKTLGWRRVTWPQETERGLEELHKNRPWFIQNSDIYGQSASELPPGETLTGTVEIHAASGIREWLERFVRENIPGAPGNPVPPGMPEQTVQRIRNSLIASEPNSCQKLLRSLRSDLLKRGPLGSTAPETLVEARNQIRRVRAELGCDVHVPAMLAGVVKLFEELGRSGRQLDPVQRLTLLRPVFDYERLTHPAQVLREVTAVCVSMGLETQVRTVADDFRDATAEARTRALGADDNEAMLWTLFDALPAIEAANDIYQALNILERESDRSSLTATIAKATDEELVRFSYAFSIQFGQLFQRGFAADLLEIRRAFGEDASSLAALRTKFEGQFSYPRKVVDTLFTTQSDTPALPV